MGIGAVLGALATGVVKVKRFGTLYLGSIALSGVLMALLGVDAPLWVAVVLFASLAFLVGFTNVLLLTWFGTKIPLDRMGRFMSLYVLLGVGLAPISNALTGITFSFSLAGTFLAAGLLQLCASSIAMFSPALRSLEI